MKLLAFTVTALLFDWFCDHWSWRLPEFDPVSTTPRTRTIVVKFAAIGGAITVPLADTGRKFETALLSTLVPTQLIDAPVGTVKVSLISGV